MTVKLLKKWLAIKSLPLVIPFERRYQRVMFARDTEVPLHLVFIASPKYFEEHPDLKEVLEKVETGNRWEVDRHRLRYAPLCDPSLAGQHGDARLFRRFRGQNADVLPGLRSLATLDSQIQNGDENKKFAFDGELTDASIRDFLERYYRNELPAYIKSEKPYDRRDGHVKVLVGSDFEKVAFDPNVNVMVEFVVPVGRRESGGA